MSLKMMTSRRMAATALQGLWGRCSQVLLGLALGWMVLVGVGCKEKEPLPVFAVTNLASTYCVFEQGSRWIYADTGLGLVDTVKLVEHHWSEEDGTGLFGNCIRQILFDEWHSSFFQTTFYGGLYADCDGNDFWVEWYKLYGGSAFFTIIDQPLSSSEVHFPTANQTSVSTRFLGVEDSLPIGGQVFRNVARFEDLPTNGVDTLRYYWSPNFGIVLKEQVGRYRWELVEWDVI